MQVDTLWQRAKGSLARMEDTYALTDHYAAVFDGATPKTAFRFPDGQTAGQVAARCLAASVAHLSPTLSARLAVDQLTLSVAASLVGKQGEASGVIFSRHRREVWRVGDCPFAFVHTDGRLEEFRPLKRIDAILSQWRASIVRSYLSRQLLTPRQILADDPGRAIIQPFITRQVRYQNLPAPDSDGLSFGVFDGQAVPDRFVEVFPVPDDVPAVILASDGYPRLCPTLQESEAVLQQLLLADPLCISSLLGTKALLPGNSSFDDRTFLKILCSRAD